MQRWPQTLNKLIDESLIKEVQPDKVLDLLSAYTHSKIVYRSKNND